MILFEYMERRNRLGRVLEACEIAYDDVKRKVTVHVGVPGQPATITGDRYDYYACSNWVARMWKKGFLPARKPRKGRFANSTWTVSFSKVKSLRGRAVRTRRRST